MVWSSGVLKIKIIVWELSKKLWGDGIKIEFFSIIFYKSKLVLNNNEFGWGLNMFMRIKFSLMILNVNYKKNENKCLATAWDISFWGGLYIWFEIKSKRLITKV